MLATFALGLLSMLFAYLSKYKNKQWGLKLAFTLIFFFLALRYNFGNDYEGYINGFKSIKEYETAELYDFLPQYEPGWILLNWIFKLPGFFAMTAVLAFFSSWIYYNFVKRFVPSDYYWLAVFLYVFNPDFMLVQASAMRQAVATMIFVFAIEFITEKKPVKYFYCIVLAALFHYSALILLPLYLLAFLNQRIRMIFSGVIIFGYIALFSFAKAFSPYLSILIQAFNEKYSFYEDGGVLKSGLGFIYILAILIITLHFEKIQKRDVAITFKIAVVGFLLMPLSISIQMFGRLGMYFLPVTAIVYPNVLQKIANPYFKTGFIIFILFVTTYQFFQFFYSDTYREYYFNYSTILSLKQ